MTGRVLAVCNQKGGVGKTAIAVGLADVLARQGKRVLIIDADPQGNATTNLAIDNTPPFTLNDVLTVDPTTRQVYPGCWLTRWCRLVKGGGLCTSSRPSWRWLAVSTTRT